jgi:flagellar protein FliS
MNKQIKTYRQVDTVGKSQIDLIIQVHSGAIQALGAGRDCYTAGDLNAGYEQIETARKFITHLYTTLDFEQGGEIAQDLGKLYVFLSGELDVIEATKDVAKIDASLRIIDNLRKGWEQLRREGKVAKAPVGQNTATDPTESLVISA